jgi:hypothetical protein
MRMIIQELLNEYSLFLPLNIDLLFINKLAEVRHLEEVALNPTNVPDRQTWHP